VKGSNGLLILFVLLLVPATFAIIVWLLSEQLELRGAGFGLAFALVAVILALLAERFLNQRDRETRVERIRGVVIRELKRNHCIATGSPRSLISTNGWDLVLEIADYFKTDEIDSLLDCYTEMRFYDHDVFYGGPDPDKRKRKQERVLGVIGGTLVTLGSSIPTGEECGRLLKGFTSGPVI